MAYTWIPFYKELAQKLFRFRRNRTPLINWIYDNLDGNIGHLKDAPDGRRVPDIDPFTVYAIFNRGITLEKRIDICNKFKDYLDISASTPQDFDGVPVMNTKQSNFIAFADKRKDGDIDRLWNVFEVAVLGKDIENEYNALEGQYLIKYNLTFALFWIRPDKYLPLDSRSQTLLFSLGITFDNKKFLRYQEYKNVMNRLNAKMRKESLGYTNYAEFSYEAFMKTSKNAEKERRKAAEAKKNCWIYAPGEQAAFWDIYYQEGIMGLGWNKIGNLKDIGTIESIESQLKWRYDTDKSQDKNADMLYSFANDMKPGDVIYVKKGRKLIVGRGIVISDYYYDKEREYQPHLRKVQWTEKGEWETVDNLPIKTLTNITGYKIVEKLDSLIEGQGNVKDALDFSGNHNYWWLTGSPRYWSPSNDWELGEDIDYTLYNEKGNKRRVFKHFSEAKPNDMVIVYESTPVLQIVAIGRVVSETDGEVLYVRKIEELLSPVSYSEILTNPLLKNSEPVMNRCQGSLFRLTYDEYKEVMRLIRKDNPESIIEEEEQAEEYATYTDEDFLAKVYMDNYQLQILKSLLMRKKNLILQGAPGVGKTFAAQRLAYTVMGVKDESRVKVIQFHQNYSYEDFVMGYKPNAEGGFSLTNGIFYDFCQQARAHREMPYFLIIDEINRGNLSKIFGELLQLIEADYRDQPIQLAYNKQRFSVPSNLYIIGMMNTADRSLAMIDYALRRRFSFFEMKPGFETEAFNNDISKLEILKLKELIDAIISLNKVIEGDDSLGSGFCIGHSYLCNLNNNSDLESIVEYDIIPMLREYWFDNDDKFNQEAQKLRNALK